MTDEERTGERLQKVLARIGIGSRRVCEDLIADGRVTVNGEVAELGRRVTAETDEVAVNGVIIGVRPGLVHLLLNKPTGVVTTADDPQGRPTVLELVPEEPRVFPVGRLDMETEGLLLLTNDGDLAHRLTHPSFGVEKEYIGAAFCERLFGGTWKQTSYNASFRKHYAGVGYTYNAVRDAFVPPQPYQSWTLDDDANWQPPVAMPTDGGMYSWDETTQTWVAE